jgi:uncharacterized protein YecE (DUF72 family)
VILVGTSGWQYKDWRERVYPKGIPQRAWLAHLSRMFPTVEVNNSFYQLPTEETFRRWRADSADGFVFAVKVSRFVTHVRRLRDCADPLELFWSRARMLRDKLGPLLVQLPPRFRADAPRLKDFLSVVPPGARVAFEFRDDTWETDEVCAMLDDYGAAWVLADRPGWRVRDVVTGGWSYIRFHEGGHQPHGAGYTREKLRRWARRIERLPASEIYVYFNNDPGGAAVRDARTLCELLSL